MDKQKLLDIVALAESEHRYLTDEEKALINKAVEERSCGEDKPKEEKSCGEKPKEEKSCEGDKPCSGDPKEEKSCEEGQKKKEERVEDEEPQTEPKEDTPTEDEEKNPKEHNKRNLNNVNHNCKMEKRYSLMKELRSALETGKSFNLNDVESRAYTVTADGEDVVQTDLYDIWEPLRAKNVKRPPPDLTKKSGSS